MRPTVARLLTASLVLAVMLAGEMPGTAAPQSGRAPTPPPPPFPSPAVMADRRRDAEARPLFTDAAPLVFTLTADFKAIDRDRNPESTKTYPATISVAGADGTVVSRAVRVRGRGHTRRALATCEFVPLRVEFTKSEMAGTPFAGQNALKLGTHCRSAAVFEQLVLREYSAYRLFNLVTPYSFRARLARGTYVDALTKKTVADKPALFLEDDDDVARRLEGRVNERRVFGFSRLDQPHLLLVTLFEYMIGNTDVAIKAQHNVRVVETPDDRRYAIPYDFDYSGLVNAPYAIVDRTRIQGITTVRERLYLGPCAAPAALDAGLAKFRSIRVEMARLYDELPGLTENSRRAAVRYLDEFYRTIDRPSEVKRVFVDGCKADG